MRLSAMAISFSTPLLLLVLAGFGVALEGALVVVLGLVVAFFPGLGVTLEVLEVFVGFLVVLGLAVGLGVAFTAAFLAEELFSFSRVLGPTVPSAERPLRRWNSSTASSVASP